MGGLFGVTSKKDCLTDVFFGTDYHSHLGTKRAGMAMYSKNGFVRAIHSIENSPFRTKFQDELDDMKGYMGIGCISDTDPQPLIVRSHLGHYAISTVGVINNIEEITENILNKRKSHFLELSGGEINPTELAAVLINQKDSLHEGIKYAQDVIKGSLTLLILNKDGIIAARDKMGRTPLIVGKKDDAYCISFESFAFLNLGYSIEKELGAGEIIHITNDGYETLVKPNDKMKICSFLWIYYGYPTSIYETKNVEQVRYNCGRNMARRDNIKTDIVAGVPDSGIAHAIGYANESKTPFARPFIKYTPTWPRSFMPPNQSMRNLIARMKIIPVDHLIKNQKLLLIDDSVVRGTQLRETTEFLYDCGASEVHIRPACPPLLYSCKYLNFSRSNSEMDLITRRIIRKREGNNITDELLKDYSNPNSENYKGMLEDIRKELNFTTLAYNRLDDMVDAIGIEPDNLCTYCWNGEE